MQIIKLDINKKNTNNSKFTNAISIEDQLITLDWKWWNDVDINLEASDFLGKLKNDVLNYDIKNGCKMD